MKFFKSHPLSTNVDTDKASTTKVPIVKAIYDWVSGLFVKGAVSSNDNAITRFDGTTGKSVQNSPLMLGDDGVISMNGRPLISPSGLPLTWLTPVAGQTANPIVNMIDLLYRMADRNPTLTSNIPNYAYMFDGNSDSSYSTNVGVGTGFYINIPLANKAGFSSNGIVYSEGALLVSFYHTYTNIVSPKLTLTSSSGVTEITSYTDISVSQGTYKLLKFNIPDLLYLTNIRFEFGSSGNTAVTQLEYVPKRYVGDPIPYISGYAGYSWMYGTLNIRDKIILNADTGNATFKHQIIDNVGSSGVDGQVLKKVGGLVLWANP